MAMAGEGATSYEGGGGTGGKFRKRPFRLPQTTPYDRPPTALRNPGRNGWLSKLVDPASKLISASAQMFFSSMFPKRLAPPLQPPSEANQEPRDRLQEAVLDVKKCTGARVLDIDRGGILTNSSGGSEISHLEQMLKQKTFTRSEIDRLTELLRSKTIESPVEGDGKRADANHSKPLSDPGRHEGFISSQVQESRNEWDKFHGTISTPVVSSRVLEEDVASPAELAKAYMSRPSKVLPSMLGLRGQVPREDATLLNNAAFPPQSPITSLVASKTAVRVGVPDNGFMTPRSRGRSAIYSMARTPYSRVHPTATLKGTGSTNYGYGRPSSPSSSSSQCAWEHDGQVGSKQEALKRRSSVLDDDIRYVGTIRSIRQKPNLSIHGSPGTGADKNAAQHRRSSTQKLLLLNEAKHKVSNTVEENGDNSIPITSYALVPSKSREMATKILQHLEKPMEKSSESKLVTVREKSPTKLTPTMLHGQALRSLENVDSLNFLQNAEYGHKLEDSHSAWLPDARDSTSQKPDKVEENGPKKLAVPHDMLISCMNGDTAVLTKDNVPNAKTANSVISNFAAQPPQKKRAFQMSAHEDSLELDDYIHCNGLTSLPSAEERDKLETSVVEGKAVSAEARTLEKPPALPEVKTPAGSVLNKRTDLEIYGGSVVSEGSTGFTFPTSPAFNTTFQPADLIQSASVFDKFVPPKDPNAYSPVISLSSEKIDKVPSFTFSSSSSANEFTGLKSGSESDSKPESSNSLANFASGTTELKILESEKGVQKNTWKAGGIMGTLETLPSATSTSSVFSFSAPVKNSNLNNGPLALNPSITSPTAPVLDSGNFSSQFSNSSSTHIPTSTSASTVASTGITTTAAFNSGLSMSAAAPSSPAAPTFSFGSSLAQSTSISTVSTISGAGTTDVKAENEKQPTFGNITSSLFGGTSFAIASTGSGLFGFSASLTSSTANSQSQVSVFGIGSGSLVSTQASPPENGVATVSQSMPTQFGSSGSSPVFGTSGITSLTSGSSLFGSSNPAAKLSGSGTSFGLSSSTSTSEINPVSFTSGATSSTFGSSWQPRKSPNSDSAFNPSSPSTGFSFGASSTSVAASIGAAMVFGSSTGASLGSMFSFNSAAATTSSLPSLSQAQPVFGISTPFLTAASNNSDQMSMEDSMAEDPVQASTPAVPVFGQAPVSPQAGFMFGPTAPLPSLPFQFGSQHNQAVPQNPSPFQASSSLDFGGGGSFSLGSSGGVDKSGRRILRVNRIRNRKK